jgi:DNA-binding transcriptional MerR regulator
VAGMHTVGELSTLAGVSVRAFHHYDEIGLLVPSSHSDTGYRLYSYADLEQLQEILVWRQLGFALEDIRALLDDTAHDREAPCCASASWCLQSRHAAAGLAAISASGCVVPASARSAARRCSARGCTARRTSTGAPGGVVEEHGAQPTRRRRWSVALGRPPAAELPRAGRAGRTQAGAPRMRR